MVSSVRMFFCYSDASHFKWLVVYVLLLLRRIYFPRFIVTSTAEFVCVCSWPASGCTASQHCRKETSSCTGCTHNCTRLRRRGRRWGTLYTLTQERKKVREAAHAHAGEEGGEGRCHAHAGEEGGEGRCTRWRRRGRRWGTLHTLTQERKNVREAAHAHAGEEEREGSCTRSRRRGRRWGALHTLTQERKKVREAAHAHAGEEGGEGSCTPSRRRGRRWGKLTLSRRRERRWGTRTGGTEERIV